MLWLRKNRICRINREQFMKNKIMLLTTCAILVLGSSCTTVRVVANDHGGAPENSEPNQTDSWSYLWGLVQKQVDVKPDANNEDHDVCREGQLSWVETETTFGGALLSLITLGIVNHRKVKWSCATETFTDDDPNN